jgi:hypothetical protein
MINFEKFEENYSKSRKLVKGLSKVKFDKECGSAYFSPQKFRQTNSLSFTQNSSNAKTLSTFVTSGANNTQFSSSNLTSPFFINKLAKSSKSSQLVLPAINVRKSKFRKK